MDQRQQKIVRGCPVSRPAAYLPKLPASSDFAYLTFLVRVAPTCSECRTHFSEQFVRKKRYTETKCALELACPRPMTTAMNESPDAIAAATTDSEPLESMDRSTAEFAERLKTELEKRDPLGRLEAVLFLAREPLHSRKLSQLAALQDGTQARSLVKQLNQHYDESGRAFRIQHVAGGFQIRTRPMFRDWLMKLQAVPTLMRLTVPAMETLAVVAYRQPVLKAEIEAIRGVGCGELLRQLLERGLVKITGRSEELGNPFLYGTTRRFLEIFGLASMDALPRGERLRGKGLPDWSLPEPAAEDETAENPDNSFINPLDEPETNSQNVVDLGTPANQLHAKDPEEE